MHNGDWTERLLAVRFGDERASEIVGDLQEQHGTRFLPLRILCLTLSIPWPEWAAVLIFASALALYQWPLTERSWVVQRWFREHHLTDGSSDLWYRLVTELSYIACFLTGLCLLRDRRSTQRVWIGIVCSVALPFSSVLVMRPYLRPAALAVSLGGGIFWAIQRRTANQAARFAIALVVSLAFDWALLKVQASIGWAYFLHLVHLHRHPGVEHGMMWPVAGLNGARCLLVALLAACTLTFTQQKPERLQAIPT